MPVASGTPRSRRSPAIARPRRAKSTMPVAGECKAGHAAAWGSISSSSAPPEPAQPRAHRSRARGAPAHPAPPSSDGRREPRSACRSARVRCRAPRSTRTCARARPRTAAPSATPARSRCRRARRRCCGSVWCAPISRLGLEHRDRQPGPPRRQLARHGQPDYAAAHDREVALAGRHGHGQPACLYGTPLASSSRSASTISRTSSSKLVRGSHPSFVARPSRGRPPAAPPRRGAGSAGRSRTWSSGSRPTWSNATSHQLAHAVGLAGGDHEVLGLVGWSISHMAST